MSERPTGFSFSYLVLLLTLLLASGAWWVTRPAAAVANARTQCANNLKNVGAMLVERSTARSLGERGGSAFLLQTYKLGMIRKGDEKVFRCPLDTRVSAAVHADRMGRLELDNVSAELTSYAAIRREYIPVRAGPKPQPWAICDRHPAGLLVLYDDASVVLLPWGSLGMGPPTGPLVLGPDAKHELLKRFAPR